MVSQQIDKFLIVYLNVKFELVGRSHCRAYKFVDASYRHHTVGVQYSILDHLQTGQKSTIQIPD